MSTDKKYKTPRKPFPEPLRGAETGTFAHHTVAVRIPDIGRRIIAENDFSNVVEGKLQALIGEIPHGLICQLSGRDAPDFGAWTRYIEPHLGRNWLEVPWFFTETYFYRRVLDTIGYFQPGPNQGLDPYAAQKRQGLETASIFPVASSQAELGRNREDSGQLLRMNLWGNQADLSLWPVDEEQRPGQGDDPGRKERILVDDSQQVAATLAENMDQPGRIDFILDNAGQELLSDLVLADYLLKAGFAGAVRLHLKSHPTFVSDAMIKDVRYTVAQLYASEDKPVRELGRRLEDHIRTERMQLVEDFFWTSPLAFWELPAQLERELSQADLIICKGEANYRRLLGDRHWPFTTPVSEVLRYVPAPLVALRVCKSEVAIGLQQEQIEEMDKLDPEWRVNGEWGLIQFVD